MDTPESGWKQRVRKLLDAYAVTAQRLSDEALISLHREYERLHMEDLVVKLRAAIEVTPLAPMQGTQNRQLPGFHVNVTFDNPQVAQRICSEITTMFMEPPRFLRLSRSLEKTGGPAPRFGG